MGTRSIPLEQHSHGRSCTEALQGLRRNTIEEMDSHCSQFLLGDKAWQCCSHTVLL